MPTLTYAKETIFPDWILVLSKISALSIYLILYMYKLQLVITRQSLVGDATCNCRRVSSLIKERRQSLDMTTFCTMYMKAVLRCGYCETPKRRNIASTCLNGHCSNSRWRLYPLTAIKIQLTTCREASHTCGLEFVTWSNSNILRASLSLIRPVGNNLNLLLKALPHR